VYIFFSNSLGIVFLPVTDTADLGVEEFELEESEAPPPFSHNLPNHTQQLNLPAPQQHQLPYHHYNQSRTQDDQPDQYQSGSSNPSFQMHQMHHVFQNHYIQTREQEMQSQQKSRLPDVEMALQLSLEEKELNLARDAELAEQLQMKENSYRTPRCGENT